MPKGMEDRDAEYYALRQPPEKTPLFDTAMELTGNIVQKANSDVRREMLEQSMKKTDGVMLLLTRRRHVHEPEHTVMAAEHCHQPGVRKELGAGLLTALVRSFERVVAAIKDGVGYFEVRFNHVRPGGRRERRVCAARTKAVHLCLDKLHIFLGNEDGLGMRARRVPPTRNTLAVLLREACIHTNDHARAI